MRICFLPLLLLVGCADKSQTLKNIEDSAQRKPDSVSANITTPYKLPLHEMEVRNINGFDYTFETDSCNNGFKYLEIWGKDTEHIAFIGSLFLEGSDNHMNTGDYEGLTAEVGDYELHSESMTFFEYSIDTRVYDDRTRRSKECVRKTILTFGKDGSIAQEEFKSERDSDPLFIEVKKRLKTRIALIDPEYTRVL